MGSIKAKIPTTRNGTVPVTFIESRNHWQLTRWVEGKKRRTYHLSKKDALDEWKSHCRRVKRFGTDSGSYSQSDHKEFSEAKRILPDVDLREAARFYLNHHPEGIKEITISDAVEQFLA